MIFHQMRMKLMFLFLLPLLLLVSPPTWAYPIPDTGHGLFSVEASASVPPTAVTQAARNVTDDSASFVGTVNPNGGDTTVFFEYGPTTSYGHTSTNGITLSGGIEAPVTVADTIHNLTPGQTYHYRVVATNAAGTTYGQDMTFVTNTTTTSTTTTSTSTTTSTTSTTTSTSSSTTMSTSTTTSTTTSTSSSTTMSTSTTTTTLPPFPTVITGPASPEPTSATLNGTVNPNGMTATYFFEYGTADNYGSFTPPRIAGSGTADIPVNAYISPLRRDTTYHYRLVASNGIVDIDGDDRTFTTSEPLVITDSKVIMVAGGGPYAENIIWDQVEMLSSTAFIALDHQGYNEDSIYYLSPNPAHDANGDGNPDVDENATGENLEKAIKFWGQDVPQLVIYLVGHGGPENFQIGKNEEVSVHDLNTWIDEAQTGMVEQVVVLYDACRSGSFLPFLRPPTGKERIIATSAEAGQRALISVDGTLSFSYVFWTHILLGYSFYDSFVSAKDTVEIASPDNSKQNSQIEGDGDGIGNGKEDKIAAESVKLGLGLKSQGALPSIGNVTAYPRTVLTGSSAMIYAKNVDAIEGVSRVWAVVTDSGQSGPAEGPIFDLPVLDLSGSNGFYEGIYEGFTTEGEYNIAVFVEDKQGLLSRPGKTTVTVVGDCLNVDEDLSIWFPCAEYYGAKYAFTLNFFKHLDGRFGFYWKLDETTIEAGETFNCIPIETDLSITIPCVSHNGSRYSFVLRPYAHPYGSPGLYWEMDLSTLVQK
jgi:hypothetical protein